ncbi:hypothetical protein Q31b_36060 [Novipirellula aureliae]|uniref:Uncharacterized protein n=1 Tax=Novipirellula aureliae TaxID=2527966 RepID=A0A5C6DU99_9BACT|nr:hypothetical protein Q31b_36060 [Novipirellula aureliae]
MRAILLVQRVLAGKIGLARFIGTHKYSFRSSALNPKSFPIDSHFEELALEINGEAFNCRGGLASLARKCSERKSLGMVVGVVVGVQPNVLRKQSRSGFSRFNEKTVSNWVSWSRSKNNVDFPVFLRFLCLEICDDPGFQGSNRLQFLKK